MEENKIKTKRSLRVLITAFVSFTFILHMIISLPVIVFAGFIFGNTLVQGSVGNDSLNALNLIVYFDRYFPHIPIWFHTQGSGMSIFFGYPQLYTYAVILIKHLTGYTYVSSMGMVNFFTIILTACGVYLFTATRLKSKTGGFIAGIFYYLSPMVYYWIWKQGFLAQTFSVIFVAPFITAYDWFLESLLSNKPKPLALLLTGIFGTLILLSHPATLYGVMAFTGLFTFGRVLFSKKNLIIKNILKGGMAMVIMGITVFLLSSFWFLPLQAVHNYTTQGMSISAEGDKDIHPRFEKGGVWGLYGFKPNYIQYEGAAYYPPIWILAIAGIILGLIFNKKVAVLSALSLFGIFISASFDTWYIVAKYIYPAFGSFFEIRSWWPITTIILPISAAMGVLYLANLILYPLFLIDKLKINKITLVFIKSIRSSLLAVLALLIAIASIYYLQKISPFYNQDSLFVVPVGYTTFQIKRFDNANKKSNNCLIESTYSDYTKCYLQKNNWGAGIANQLKLSGLKYGEDDWGLYINTLDPELAVNKVITEENHRIDLTTDMGAVLKTWDIKNKSSTLNAYFGTGMVNKGYYSFYNDNIHDNKNISPEMINNMGNYFGTEAIIVNSAKSDMVSFEKAGWAVNGKGQFPAMTPPFKTGLVSIAKFNKILVVGSEKNDVYKQLFHIAVNDVTPFDKGILVKGPESIGDVSADELSKYSLVVMHGYKYGNRNEDLDKLKNYVSNGGNLFIDTGWQYVSSDWGKTGNTNNSFTKLIMPEPFPVTSVQWGSAGRSWDDGEISSVYRTDISLNDFSPLIWEDSDWSVSAGSDIRSWAAPIITKGGKILAAEGNLGSGRVVWSGMNIFAHALDKKNETEIRLLKYIFMKLLENKNGELISEFSLNRLKPEILEITANTNITSGSDLYFRESYFPNWSAYVWSRGSKNSLKVYMSGPVYMLVNLPQLNTGDKVVFEFNPPWQFYAGTVISIITFFVLVILVMDSLITRGKLLNYFHRKSGHAISHITKPIVHRARKAKENFNKEENEDY